MFLVIFYKWKEVFLYTEVQVELCVFIQRYEGFFFLLDLSVTGHFPLAETLLCGRRMNE